jgi:hypothetical protein
MSENLGGKGGDFWGGLLPFLLSPLFLLLGAGLLLRCVEAAATIGSWPLRASHRASAAFTMAAAVLWAPAPIVSLIDGGRQIKNIARKRSLSGDTPGGRCCLSFPMRTLGLSIFQKETARLSRFRHQEYLKCPEGLAWEGWQGHWHI